MDSLFTTVSAALLIGGGAVVYTQCINTKSNKASQSPSSNNTSTKTTAAKSSTRKSDDTSDSYNPEDFLTPKQLKQLQSNKQRELEQQRAAEKLKVKKEQEENRRKAAAAKAAEEAAATPVVTTPTQSNKKDAKKNAKQQPQAKLSAADQAAAAEKKRLEKEQRKKEEKKRQAELEAQMLKKMQAQDSKTNKVAQKKKEDEALLNQDPEWTSVMTKKQRDRQRKLRHVDSDSDDEDMTNVTLIEEDLTGGAVAPQVVVEKVKVMVPIPEKQRFIIIGKGGETVEAIKAKTGCWISIPSEEDIKKDLARIYSQKPIYVAVEGPKPGAKMAEKIILELADKGFSSTLSDGLIQSKFNVDPAKRAAIIGPKGSYIDILQKTLEIKIIMPDRLSRDTAVLIAGKREAVNQCKKALQDLIDQGFSSITHPTWIKHAMTFSSSHRRRLIGRAGQVIKSLQASTDCKITFPKSETKDVVYILGEKNNISRAVKSIEKLLAQIQYDEEESAYNAVKNESDQEEIDEELAQYMYIPDEDEY